MAFCRNCGEALRPEGRFCGRCGALLTDRALAGATSVSVSAEAAGPSSPPPAAPAQPLLAPGSGPYQANYDSYFAPKKRRLWLIALVAGAALALLSGMITLGVYTARALQNSGFYRELEGGAGIDLFDGFRPGRDQQEILDRYDPADNYYAFFGGSWISSADDYGYREHFIFSPDGSFLHSYSAQTDADGNLTFSSSDEAIYIGAYDIVGNASALTVNLSYDGYYYGEQFYFDSFEEAHDIVVESDDSFYLVGGQIRLKFTRAM